MHYQGMNDAQASQLMDSPHPQAGTIVTQYSGHNAYTTPVPASTLGVSSQVAEDQWYQKQYNQQYLRCDSSSQYTQQL
jgi:hypothetical protein